MVPRVLVCAGRDSSGRAGLDADAMAIEAFGAEAVSVVTTETVQKGPSILDIQPRPEAVWLDELRQRQVGVAVWKSGLLYGAAAVEAFATAVETFGEGRTVLCDPVLAATGGERFLDGRGVAALRDTLLPLGVILTPNLPEAAEIAGMGPSDWEAMAREPELRLRAAHELLELGAAAVLLKGGHGGEDPVRDLVLERDTEPLWLEHARIAGPGMRGSGCRYASSVAALLARGESLPEAARRAAEKVLEWIRQGVCVDEGSR